jgi:divalent metal cation (Fe/Co/Zn/Cd) transporter
VLLEDSGALIGLCCALLGVLLSTATGNPRFDALGSLGIDVLLVLVAITLAMEMKSLPIGESARRRTWRPSGR